MSRWVNRSKASTTFACRKNLSYEVVYVAQKSEAEQPWPKVLISSADLALMHP